MYNKSMKNIKGTFIGIIAAGLNVRSMLVCGSASSSFLCHSSRLSSFALVPLLLAAAGLIISLLHNFRVRGGAQLNNYVIFSSRLLSTLALVGWFIGYIFMSGAY